MNLWVRSQDRKRLTECYDFALQEKLQGTFAVLGSQHINHILGTYKNRQRALEVIDEIQKLLLGNIIVMKNLECNKRLKDYLKPSKVLGVVEQDRNSQIEYIHKDCIVYEMPKE